MEVIDCLLHEKNYLALEPLYSSLVAVRLYVDAPEKLAYLGCSNFYNSYLTWIRSYFVDNSIEEIAELLPFITNPEGIYVYTQELTILLTIESQNYSPQLYHIDPKVFVALSKNLSYPNYKKAYVLLAESIRDFDTETSHEWLVSIVKTFLEANKIDELKSFYGDYLNNLIIGTINYVDDENTVMKCWELLERGGRLEIKKNILEFNNIKDIISPLLENVREFTVLEKIENGGWFAESKTYSYILQLNIYFYSIVVGSENYYCPIAALSEGMERKNGESLAAVALGWILVYSSYQTLEHFIHHKSSVELYPVIDDLFRHSSIKKLFYIPQLRGKGNARTILRYIRDPSLIKELKEGLITCTIPSIEDELAVRQHYIMCIEELLPVR